jgi:NAD/NADP transhydrogenase beta subunit
MSLAATHLTEGPCLIARFNSVHGGMTIFVATENINKKHSTDMSPGIKCSKIWTIKN